MIENRRYLSATGKDAFGEWFSRLTDLKARARVAIRIDRLAAGNFGDTRPLGGDYIEKARELLRDYKERAAQ